MNSVMRLKLVEDVQLLFKKSLRCRSLQPASRFVELQQISIAGSDYGLSEMRLKNLLCSETSRFIL